MNTTETKAHKATTATSSGTRFDSLALNPATLANLEQLGYLEMTPSRP
jgi:superfamily II DNA/RNA helicase